MPCWVSPPSTVDGYDDIEVRPEASGPRSAEGTGESLSDRGFIGSDSTIPPHVVRPRWPDEMREGLIRRAQAELWSAFIQGRFEFVEYAEAGASPPEATAAEGGRAAAGQGSPTNAWRERRGDWQGAAWDEWAGHEWWQGR